MKILYDPGSVFREIFKLDHPGGLKAFHASGAERGSSDGGKASRKQRAAVVTKRGRDDALLSGGGQPTIRRTVLGSN